MYEELVRLLDHISVAYVTLGLKPWASRRVYYQYKALQDSLLCWSRQCYPGNSRSSKFRIILLIEDEVSKIWLLLTSQTQEIEGQNIMFFFNGCRAHLVLFELDKPISR